jgi:hypothetical protein
MESTVAYDRIVARLRTIGKIVLESTRPTMAQCPAHDDHTPSLAIYRKPGKIKVICFAGCDDVDVLAAIGLTIKDLYDEPMTRRNGSYGKPPPPKPKQDPNAWLRDIIRELNGQRIPGGCEECDSYQTAREDPDHPNIFHIHTWHEEECPWLAEREARAS